MRYQKLPQMFFLDCLPDKLRLLQQLRSLEMALLGNRQGEQSGLQLQGEKPLQHCICAFSFTGQAEARCGALLACVRNERALWRVANGMHSYGAPVPAPARASLAAGCSPAPVARTGPAGAGEEIHDSSAMRFAACDVSMTSPWWRKNRHICLHSTLIVMVPGEVHRTVLPGPAVC